MTPSTDAPDPRAPARKQGRKRRAVSRIVLTIEPESLGGEAIDTAVRLARAYGAELVAVFVKTSDMMNMVSLPFGATVTSLAGVTRIIDRGMLDHRLDRMARQAETLLARSASGVRWSFAIASGHTDEVAAGTALGGDLLAVCSRTARRIAETVDAACSLLLLGNGLAAARPVIALYEGDTGVLAAARQMAEALGRELGVVLSHGLDARARRRGLDWLARHGAAAQLMQFSSPDAAALAAEIEGMRPGLLVMARGGVAAGTVRAALEDGRKAIPLLLVS